MKEGPDSLPELLTRREKRDDFRSRFRESHLYPFSSPHKHLAMEADRGTLKSDDLTQMDAQQSSAISAADFLNTLGRDLENGDRDGKGERGADRSDRGEASFVPLRTGANTSSDLGCVSLFALVSLGAPSTQIS
jgi:hypothetical protein